MNAGYSKGRRHFGAIRAELTETKPGKGIVIHYADRQPRTGKGSIHGIRSPAHLDLYKRTLEWTHDFLTSSAVGLPAHKGPIPVYCFEISEWRGEPDPVTFDGPAGIPVIALPSRTSIVAAASERQYMVSAAAHEMTHAVCTSAPGMISVERVQNSRWLWLAEATSVWVETRLAKRCETDSDIVDWLFYALNWCDLPEIPLDAYEGVYQSAQFLRYLVEINEPAIVGKLWKAGNADEDPWVSIEEMTGKTKDDLFVDYVAQSYLLNDEKSKCYFPEIYERFGGRLVTESWELGIGESAVAEGTVWPLGCHYYRVNASGIVSVEVKWDGTGNEGVTLILGAATEELKGATGTVTMRGPGTRQLQFGGAHNHVWVAVCGKADVDETFYSFTLRGQ